MFVTQFGCSFVVAAISLNCYSDRLTDTVCCVVIDSCCAYTLLYHLLQQFYAFTGMLFNILLVPLTKAIENHFGKGSQAGNWIFWTIFCIVGQPMSVLVSD
jgi:hypothetical protein